MRNIGYSDDLDPDEQVDAEEEVTAIIFEGQGFEGSEEEAAELGRKVLYSVLSRFRPDLFDTEIDG